MKIIILGDFFERLRERMSGRDELEEMSGLRKSDAGLPVNIWLDDSKAYVRGHHAKRIKFQGDRGNSINPSNLFSMIISKDNPQIPSKQLSRLRLPTKDIEAVKTFVKNNADLLSMLADAEISFMAFIQRMKV
jgi:hypothetical protein